MVQYEQFESKSIGKFRYIGRYEMNLLYYSTVHRLLISQSEKTGRENCRKAVILVEILCRALVVLSLHMLTKLSFLFLRSLFGNSLPPKRRHENRQGYEGYETFT